MLPTSLAIVVPAFNLITSVPLNWEVHPTITIVASLRVIFWPSVIHHRPPSCGPVVPLSRSFMPFNHALLNLLYSVVAGSTTVRLAKSPEIQHHSSFPCLEVQTRDKLFDLASLIRHLNRSKSSQQQQSFVILLHYR